MSWKIRPGTTRELRGQNLHLPAARRRRCARKDIYVNSLKFLIHYWDRYMIIIFFVECGFYFCAGKVTGGRETPDWSSALLKYSCFCNIMIVNWHVDSPNIYKTFMKPWPPCGGAPRRGRTTSTNEIFSARFPHVCMNSWWIRFRVNSTDVTFFHWNFSIISKIFHWLTI